jgi:hypothetical protein
MLRRKQKTSRIRFEDAEGSIVQTRVCCLSLLIEERESVLNLPAAAVQDLLEDVPGSAG